VYALRVNFDLATTSPIRAAYRLPLCASCHLSPSLSHRLRDHFDIAFVRRHGFLVLAQTAAEAGVDQPRRAGRPRSVCIPFTWNAFSLSDRHAATKIGESLTLLTRLTSTCKSMRPASLANQLLRVSSNRVERHSKYATTVTKAR
jgi:hypothetical protein